MTSRNGAHRDAAFEADLQGLASRIRLEVERSTARSLCLVGAHPGAGVSTLSCLLAGEVAASGWETILADGNPSHASLHERFSVAASPGAADVMAGRLSLEECMSKVAPRLFVLPAGRRTADMPAPPAGAWSDLVARAIGPGRVVIVDAGCPGPSGLPDAAAATDGIVIVAEAGRTRWEQVASIADRAVGLEIPVLGAILNRRTFPIPEVIYRWI